MLREDFERLVLRLEAVEKRHPQWYRWRLVLLIGLGYLYLVGVMFVGAVLTLGGVALLVAQPNLATIKLAVCAVVIGGSASWAILRALWVHIPPPEGLQVTEAEAPALFHVIRGICTRIGTPEPYRVLLVSQYNASVCQVPRLGIFGWYRAYLLLGLPMMQNLSAEEFTAVLAHEFGHLSRSHCRFGGWVYRTRQTWERVMGELFRRQNRAARVLQAFLRWFWPAFNARAFVLARANEYEADRCSAELAGVTPSGQALARLNVYGPVAEQFWEDVDRWNQRQEQPPLDIMQQLGRRLAGPVPAEQARHALEIALRLPTHCADTHPGLRDRLHALGCIRGEAAAEVPLPVLPQKSAAEVLLGERYGDLTSRLSGQWAQWAGPIWTARHEQAVKSRQALAVLTAKPPQETTVDDLWTQIQLLVDLEGDAAAQSTAEAILSREPEHAGAAFIRGRHLLAQDDAAGIPWLDRAMQRNPRFTEPCVALIQAYHARAGAAAQIRQLDRRLDEHDQQMEIAARERAGITVKDHFAPNDLSENARAEVSGVLAAESEIARAWVARKVVTALPEEPVYVIALEVRERWWKYRGRKANQLLVQRVQSHVRLPGYICVFTIAGNLVSLGKKIAKVPGSIVFKRRS
jgi:Zn-dependent protease with chaperone function